MVLNADEAAKLTEETRWKKARAAEIRDFFVEKIEPKIRSAAKEGKNSVDITPHGVDRDVRMYISDLGYGIEEEYKDNPPGRLVRYKINW